ncbi:MAG: hypothetical protein V1903_14095 [Bacteroidota bacterium]
MKKKNFTGILQELINRGESGKSEDVDFALSLVENHYISNHR